ncbi:Uncharacterised protein [uncultured Bacteroides sp.]|nr:Uncharacterised protein [uncultured Bacteroides sp.]
MLEIKISPISIGLYHRFFVLLYSNQDDYFQNILEKEKHSTYQEFRNIGNFQTTHSKSIVILTL